MSRASQTKKNPFAKAKKYLMKQAKINSVTDYNEGRPGKPDSVAAYGEPRQSHPKKLAKTSGKTGSPKTKRKKYSGDKSAIARGGNY